jgi:hypothetical protein
LALAAAAAPKGCRRFERARLKARLKKPKIEKRGASRHHDEINRESVTNEVLQGLNSFLKNFLATFTDPLIRGSFNSQ